MIGLGWSRLADRPTWRGLAVQVDGPEPSSARAVLFFLHGHGGSNADVAWLGKPLRAAGVPSDASIVFIEAPFATGFGRQWGDDTAQRLIARDRVREAMTKVFGASSLIPEHVLIAGFSQGAQLAADVAAVDTRVGGVVLLSPCGFVQRDPFREEASLLIAHGKEDRLCKFETTSELVSSIEKDHAVTFVPFESGHEIDPVEIEAVAKLLAVEPPK